MSVTGKYLSCTVAGARVTGLHRWEADDSGSDELDATTGDDLGYTNRDVGCQDLTIRLSLLIDLAKQPGVALAAGSLIADLRLFHSSADTVPAFRIPLALVTGVPESAEVRGRLEATVTAKNKGPWFKGT